MLTLAVGLALSLYSTAPFWACADRCEAAAGHHCPQVPSLKCCCTVDTPATVDVVTGLVTKQSLTPLTLPGNARLVVADTAAVSDARVRFWAATPPSHASPPPDRTILYATLLI